MRRAGHLACTRETKMHKKFTGKPEGKDHLAYPS
jgi:hypothetical protein